MVYKWKSNSRIKADADVAGAMCEQLEKTVGLTPETLLEANRDDSAPLHSAFEWDDSIAAEKYRVNQAGHIIRCLCVAKETEGETSVPLRAFFRTVESDSFESISTIIRSEDKHQALLRTAQKELDAYIAKYKTLAELKKLLISAIENIKEESA